LLDAEASNVLIMNLETVAKIRMTHRRTTHSCIIEIGQGQVDIQLSRLPAGHAAKLLGAAGAPTSGILGRSISSGVGLP
jgi:hypothetical protein